MGNCLANLLLSLLAASSGLEAREAVVGLPCDGCEAAFEGMPRNLPAHSRIAPHGEPGERMTVSGRVYGAGGEPRPGVIVYAYHTNAEGIYPAPEGSAGRATDRHGLLRGWVRTDTDGRYTFDTIRPASYPTRDLPAHIHMHVVEPGCATYYIDDIKFTDDPLLTPAERSRKTARGGNGIATPTRSGDAWQVTRDIALGANIPGYPQCGAGRAAD